MSGRALSALGKSCAGHGCFPPRPIVSASDNVFVNSIQAARNGDYLSVHACKNSAHNGTITGGSSTVFINGKPAGRIGDAVSCGTVVAQGSKNVFVG